MARDNEFQIEISKFYAGQAPAAHISQLTELGDYAHYSVATNVDLTDPTNLQPGSGLSTLTAGTEAGAITELVTFILDKPTSNNVTFGIGATKLQKISATAVTNTGAWPHTITGATDGESIIEFQGALYYFYNKASGADIGKYDLNVTFDDDWGSTVPTGAAALQSAPHPVAKKEDIMLFGNGRYAGTYISGTNTLTPTKLDFGSSSEVADVTFHANQWYLAVNSGVTSGTNRSSASVYLYDAGATNAILADEISVGVQKIGFITPVNGTIFICYRDESGANVFGYLSGRAVKPLAYFTGNLPTYEKKTLYKNFVIFESSGLIYAAGYSHPDLPFSFFQLADAGFTTGGALSAPFGTPMTASTQSTSFKLAQFSGYDVVSTWKSIVIPISGSGRLGQVDSITVLTNTLGSGASCALTIEFNQAASTSNTLTLATTGKRRHTLHEVGATDCEDLRIVLDHALGSTSNPVKIRKIIIHGTWIESI